MSSVSDFVTKLLLSEKYLYEFVSPILMGIGSISCILSLIVFTKKNLRKNPCSIYFIALNITNFLLIYTSILSSTLASGYNIVPSSYNLIVCRLTVYIALLLDILSPSYLILASIDRILVTSPNARTRRRSTQRFAYICISCVTLFWVLFHSNALFLVNITEIAPYDFVCYFASGTALIFIAYYALITAILIPLIMIILGTWTLKNIRSIRRIRIGPIFSTTGMAMRGIVHSAHAKDRQLVLILLMDIIIYVLFNGMLSGVIMYLQITQYNVKTLDQSQIDLFLRNIGTFICYIPFCIGCYTNAFVSKTFRKELKDTLLCK